MPKLTITEALAEVKTLKARIVKKQEAVRRFVVREGRLKDPLEKQGGSEEYVKRERQALDDLRTRIVTIRTKIQHVNLETMLTIGDLTGSLQTWLNWRKEVSDEVTTFLTQLTNTITTARTTAQRRGEDAKEDVLVMLDEKELAEEVERHAKILGDLDGKLSLLNATTTIELD